MVSGTYGAIPGSNTTTGGMGAFNYGTYHLYSPYDEADAAYPNALGSESGDGFDIFPNTSITVCRATGPGPARSPATRS